jgi:hypothetical protein
MIVSLDKPLHTQLLARKDGRTLTHLMDTAVRQYLDDTRIYLDVPEEVRAKLRERCVVGGKTLNEVVNEILAKYFAVEGEPHNLGKDPKIIKEAK